MLPKLEKALKDLTSIKSVVNGSEISIRVLCANDEEMDRFDREICVFISYLKNVCDAWMDYQRKTIERNDPDFYTDFVLNIEEDLDRADDGDFDPEEGEE